MCAVNTHRATALLLPARLINRFPCSSRANRSFLRSDTKRLTYSTTRPSKNGAVGREQSSCKILVMVLPCPISSHCCFKAQRDNCKCDEIRLRPLEATKLHHCHRAHPRFPRRRPHLVPALAIPKWRCHPRLRRRLRLRQRPLQPLLAPRPHPRLRRRSSDIPDDGFLLSSRLQRQPSPPQSLPPTPAWLGHPRLRRRPVVHLNSSLHPPPLLHLLHHHPSARVNVQPSHFPAMVTKRHPIQSPHPYPRRNSPGGDDCRSTFH